MTKALSLISLAAISVALGAQAPTSPETQDRSAMATPQTPSEPQSATEAPASAERARATQVDATSVNAELTKGLDAKRAHVGDEVDARTTSEAKLADGTTLPRGTKLVGNVVDVKAKSKEEKDSRMVISLNRAVLKDGRQVPIQTAVTSMTAPAQSGGNSPDNNYATVTVPSSGGETGGGSGSGGSAAAPAPSAPMSRSVPSSDTAQSQQSQMLKGTGDRVNVGNKPKITLSAPTTPDSAAVLEAQGENVSLESGTKLTLNVIPAHG